MKKPLFPLILGLAGVFAIATAFGTGDEPLDEPEDDGVVLGEEDLAEHGEILRNQFRRMTPGDEPLVQDIGKWPVAWEEFGTNWDSATAEQAYGAWVVPVELTQENGATVMKDWDGHELWRGTTDFARPESAAVVLTGGLVAEEDWAVYEAVRGAVEEMSAEASRVDAPRNTSPDTDSGLRFTGHEWTVDNTFRLELAYEMDTNVDIFAYAVLHASNQVNSIWTNDENMVIQQSYTVWVPSGASFDGRDSDWTYLDTVSISNGVAEFEDSGFPDELGKLRFYALAVANDSDGDGLNDGQEAFIFHSDPMNTDSDGDGLDDGDEINVYGTSPANADTDGDGIGDGVDTFPCTSNVWFVTTTTNGLYYQRLLPDCGLNAPETTIEDWSWTVTGQVPTADSVVLDVRVNGYVDDYVKVDTHSVDPGQGPRTYIHRHVTNEIADLQSRQFSINLVDWPDPTHSGPNEVRLGTSETDKFMVVWDWGVPMALTGPEYVCVDDTAQFVATGAGGGPYAWSVDTDPATPAAAIDPASGLLTALAPGIATVIATVGDVYAVSQAVNVVQIDFLTGDGNTPASSLKIGKWENAFWSTITTNGDTVTTNVFLRENFIDLDPDRFKVRVIDTGRAGQEIVPIALYTTSNEPNLCDDSTGLLLYETSGNSGVFISTNLLLVADDIDDDFTNPSVPADDAVHDRTHKIGLGGEVHIQYPSGEEVWAQKEIEVPAEATVRITPVFLHDATLSNNDDVVLSKQEIEDFLRIAGKRYAQIGIALTWDEPVICAPPSGVDLSDGLMVRTNYEANTVAPEAKAAVDGVGTPGNLTDIHLIIVNKLLAGDHEVGGMAVAPIRFSTDTAYQFNIFLTASHVQEWSGGSIAHELGHLLTNSGHVKDSWRLMYETTLYGVTGTRRFVSSEENTIKGNSHVQSIGL